MRPLGTYRAAPRLPDNLAPLSGLARDLRWAWREDVRRLFVELDTDAWARAGGNPVEALRIADPARLAQKSADTAYVAAVAAARDRLLEEDRAGRRSPEAEELVSKSARIAYFCAEFGVTEVLPIYSGGLGVLAGDHLKSSSDLGVPLTAVGLFYREGYFRQELAADARQKESYPVANPADLPLDFLETPSGGPPIVTVRIADRDVHVLVRRARVGRVTLLLLDSHLPVNRRADREITSRLYGGDVETRIQQEIVLGIGGIRALDLAGLRPTICHANEGHAAFLGLERIRQLRLERGLGFDEAREVVVASNVFTTHTPVPAGIDLFSTELMRKYFENEVEGYGLSFEKFLGLGRQVEEDAHELFSMAVLGLHMSSHVNGVSRLHATVSRRLWRGVFPEAPLSEMPISAVTNGVHPPTWTAPEIAELNVAANPEVVDKDELWRRHERLRARLVQEVRARTAVGRQRRGAPDAEISAAYGLLDEKALTITFARRFATYKRATLVFHDPERLARILNDVERPVQMIFAGKAHPRDEAGKGFLNRIGELSLRPEFAPRIVVLEDYDIGLARVLVAGSDVWLNNPRRPQEASGTSGMKAAMNGALNLSVLDGWWDEAPREGTGFTVGSEANAREDEEIAAALYEKLENEVIPLFYDRANEPGIERRPVRWVDRMVGAASTLARLFSSDRMVTDYIRQAYIPAVDRTRALSADDTRRAKDLAAWKARVAAAWDSVGFVAVQLSPNDPAHLPPGERFRAEVQVRLDGLSPDELTVDWFEGTIDPDGVVDEGRSTPLAHVEQTDGVATYAGTITRPADETLGYSVRIRPRHADLVHPNETGLFLWAG
jgi:starch phosphorylase